MKVVQLKTIAEPAVVDKLRELIEQCADHNYVAMACVLLRADGSGFISTIGRGKRVELLGMVTDLQFSLASDGDRP